MLVKHICFIVKLMERVDESVGFLMPRIKSVKTSVRAEKDADWERERGVEM